MARRGTRGALSALAVMVLGLGLLATRLPLPSAAVIACDGCPARTQVAVDLRRGPQATEPRRDRIPAGALVERADGTLNGYAAVRYHGQVGWVAASALEPLPVTAPAAPWSSAASRLAVLTRRLPLWLSGLLAALGLGRRRPDVVRPAAIVGRGARGRLPWSADGATATGESAALTERERVQVEAERRRERALLAAIARQILLGARESLTIAGRLSQPASVVNAALPQLRARCHGCIAVTQPYQGEARFTIALVSRAALAQLLDEEARAARVGRA